jgi:hypothetical protein
MAILLSVHFGGVGSLKAVTNLWAAWRTNSHSGSSNGGNQDGEAAYRSTGPAGF